MEQKNISSLEERRSYFFKTMGCSRNPKKAIRKFFKNFLKEDHDYKKIVLLIGYPKNVTIHYVLNLLNSYGMYGTDGDVDKLQEWKFSLPWEHDEIVANIISSDGHDYSTSTIYIQKRLRERKFNYFVGELVNLRDLYPSE